MEAEEQDARHNVTASGSDGRNGTPLQVGVSDTPRRIVREVYDIWGNSLGFVMFTVPVDFKERDKTPPPNALNQYFAASAEAMEEIRRLSGYSN